MSGVYGRVNGNILVSVFTFSGNETLLMESDTTVVRVPPGVSPTTHYYSSGEFLPFPERPSDWHEFNYDAKMWELDSEAVWSSVRVRRDRLLASCDWVVSRALETGSPVPEPWLIYRQALRDITNQPDPIKLTWPKPPEP